jgi:hypothetical protein
VASTLFCRFIIRRLAKQLSRWGATYCRARCCALSRGTCVPRVSPRATCPSFDRSSGKIVVYIYNPFGREVLAKVLAALEAAMVAERREVYLANMYPSLLECIEASPGFKRHFETTVKFAPEEVGYGTSARGSSRSGGADRRDRTRRMLATSG